MVQPKIKEQSTFEQYFTNQFGERWIVLVEAQTLSITHIDDECEKIALTPNEAFEVYEVFAGLKNATENFAQNPIHRWTFSSEDKMWLTSILEICFV